MDGRSAQQLPVEHHGCQVEDHRVTRIFITGGTPLHLLNAVNAETVARVWDEKKTI
ncbi:MAG: hypothetical protein GYA18_04615 [Chloroflexi bacterium]|nr:hypothetical protein [Chloroflexota bacterium]